MKKNIGKRILSLALALVLVVGLLPMRADAVEYTSPTIKDSGIITDTTVTWERTFTFDNGFKINTSGIGCSKNYITQHRHEYTVDENSVKLTVNDSGLTFSMSYSFTCDNQTYTDSISTTLSDFSCTTTYDPRSWWFTKGVPTVGYDYTTVLFWLYRDGTAHTGDATCQTAANCTLCGESYYADHVYDTNPTGNGLKHYHPCMTENCTAKYEEKTYTQGDHAIIETCNFSGCDRALTITLPEITESYTYTGAGIRPLGNEDVVYSIGGNTIAFDTIPADDRVPVQYENNVNAGTAKAYIEKGGKKVEQPFTINPASIAGATVELQSISEKYTGGDLTPTVAVTYSGIQLTEHTDYEISWHPANVVDVGTYQIKIKGNGNFKDEATLNQTFTITRATPTAANFVLTPPTSLTYDGGEKKATVAVAEGIVGMGNVTAVHYFNSAGEEVETPTAVDTYTVKVDVAEGGNYEAITRLAVGSFTIEKATPTADLFEMTLPQNPVYDGTTTFPVTVTPKTTDLGEITAVKYNGSTDVPVNAGTYKVTVDVEEGKNYNAATVELGSFTVAQDDGSATVSIEGWEYGDTAKAPVPVSSTNGTDHVTYQYKVKDADDSTYTNEVPTLPGDYTVKANFPATTNYKATEATADFTISKRAVTATVTAQNKTYDGTTDTVITATVEDVVYGDTFEISGLTGAFSDANAGEGKTVTIDSSNASVTGTNVEYYVVSFPATATATIAKAAAPTIDFPEVLNAITYGQKLEEAKLSFYTNDYGTFNWNAPTAYPGEAGTISCALDFYPNELALQNYDWKDAGNAQWIASRNALCICPDVTVNKAASTITTAPTANDLTYNGGALALVTEGTVIGGTMQYKLGEDGEWSTEVPSATNATTYTVYYQIVGDSNHLDMEAKSVTVTIKKADYDMTAAKWDYTSAFQYDGLEHTVTVTGLPSGVTVKKYSGNSASVVGDYTAKVTFTYDEDNYNTPVLADLTWAIENNWNPTEYTTNGSEWKNTDFVITAKDGYLLSTTNTADGTWVDSFTGSTEGEHGITFYVKNTTTGAISLAVTESYKLDKTAPTGTVSIDENKWSDLWNTITFGLFFKETKTVSVTASDNLSGVAKIEYIESKTALDLDAVKAATQWTEMKNGSVSVTLEDTKQFIYYIRITDKAGNVAFLSTDGAEYDTTAPVITGVDNGVTYYTTQKVTVTDKNIDTITLNGEAATDAITLEGNKEANYTIVATDKAGNSTTVTVTMKPIKELAKATENLGNDNVTSANTPALEALVEKLDELLADDDVTDGERETLEQHKTIAESLIQTIEDTAAEQKAVTDKAAEFDEDKVKSIDKAELEKLAEDIEALLDTNNLTQDERTALETLLEQVEDMTDTIDKTAADSKTATDAIDALDPETVKSTDKAAVEAALETIENLLDGDHLTDTERDALEDAKADAEALLDAIEEAAKAANTENTAKVEDVTADNVTPKDKSDLEDAKADLEKALEDNSGNYTEEEKKAIEDEIARIDEALQIIENVEAVEDTISDLPATVEPDDEETVAKIEDAKKAYDELTEYEKSLVDEDTKKKLDDLTAAAVAYEIVKGDNGKWTKGSTSGLSFTANGPLGKFSGIEIDGKVIDAKYYDAVAGSTVITLKASYLETLSTGKHTITVVYTDGETEGIFKINAKSATPATGDESNIMLYGSMFTMSLAALVVLLLASKKRKQAS